MAVSDCRFDGRSRKASNRTSSLAAGSLLPIKAILITTILITTILGEEDSSHTVMLIKAIIINLKCSRSPHAGLKVLKLKVFSFAGLASKARKKEEISLSLSLFGQFVSKSCKVF